jgi:hypothetical protein
MTNQTEPSHDGSRGWNPVTVIVTVVVIAVIAYNWHTKQSQQASLEEELGTFGLASTATACDETPWDADWAHAEKVLKTLLWSDFGDMDSFVGSQNGVVGSDQDFRIADTWRSVHHSMSIAFRTESWAQPESVNLERNGVDHTASVMKVREIWWGAEYSRSDHNPYGLDLTEPGSWMTMWWDGCAPVGLRDSRPH